jgi:RNA polymerase sigma-70 factor, ECF subfamily
MDAQPALSSERDASPTGPPEAVAALPDALLLSRIAEGDLAVFDHFVDRYKHRLVAYLGRRIPDMHHREDLAQEVFMRAFRAARQGTYTGEASVATWLFTIAGNCVNDHLRARVRRPETASSQLADDPLASRLAPGLTPADAAARQEGDQRVRRLLLLLSPEQQQVVTLRIFGGLTFSEIAEVTGCPLPTVKSRMAYALDHLSTGLRNQERL